MTFPPLVIGHRGASGYELENTRAAFRTAVELGADGVELDVHPTIDHALVVHHDPQLAGGERIAGLTAAQVAQRPLASGETAPLLEEALEILGPLKVFVEVKALDPEDDTVLLRTLDAGPNPSGYAVHSFDHRAIARLGRLRPALPRGILLCSRPVDPVPLAEMAGATAVWQDHQWIDAEGVSRMHAHGLEVIAWTVADDAEVHRLYRTGVDGLCGNFPDRIRSAVEAGDE